MDSVFDQAGQLVGPLLTNLLLPRLVFWLRGRERGARVAFAEEELDQDGFGTGGGGGEGFRGGGARGGEFLGREVGDGREGVDFADRGRGVVDVEVCERGVACAAIEASTGERECETFIYVQCCN